MCECVKNVNEMLAERNTRLKEALVMRPVKGKDYLFIETEQIETGRGKAKATSMFASFCPFCGEKHPEKEG